MDDIAKLGIGFETAQAVANAKAFDKSLSGITGTTASMTKAMIASQLALDAVKKAFSVVSSEISKTVTIGIQFEKTMSQVKAVSNATEIQFKDLTRAAKLMGEQTMFSASEAAQGLVLLSQAGLKAEQSMAALPQVLNLAAAGGLSLAESADIATNAMSGMRMGVQDLGKITDVFAKTAASSNTNVRMMGESFTYAASIAASAGVSIEELSALIGVLGNAGIQGSMAGTQLAFGISKALESGKTFLQVLEELEARGAKATEVMDMFGERAGRGALAILGQGTSTVRAFANELSNADGAAKKMADTMQDNLAGDLKTLESAIEAVRIELFEAFSPNLRSIVQQITKAVRENKEEIVSYAEKIRTGLLSAYTELTTEGTYLNRQLVEAKTSIIEAASAIVEFYMGAKELHAILKNLIESSRTITDEWPLMTQVVKGAATVIIAAGASIENMSLRIAQLSSVLGALSAGSLTVALDEMLRFDEQIKMAAERNIKLVDGLWSEKKALEGVSKAATTASSAIAQLQSNTTQTDIKTKELGIKYEAFVPVIDEVVSEETLLTSAINKATNAIEKQSQAFEKTSVAANSASEAVGKFSGSSLAGQTFTVTRGVADTAGASMGSMTSATSATSAPSMAGILKRAEALQYAFLAEDQLLSEMRQKLIKTADDYGKISKDSLEEQLDNLEEQQRLIKQIETIENRQNTEKLSNFAKQNALLDQFSDEAAELAMQGLIPKDLLDATKAQYADLQAKVNEIDFSTITEADTALLAKFKESAEAYLDSAASVWKSSEQYQVIKDEVQSQFSAIASSIKSQMAPAAFTAASASNAVGGLSLAMTAITKNEPNATSALSDIAAGAGDLNNAAGSLTGGLSQAAAAAGQTADNAVLLQSDLNNATKPFDTMTLSLQTFADQIKAMATQISQSATGTIPEGGSGIPTGGGTTGGTTQAIFQKYVSSQGSLYRQMSDGQMIKEMQPYLGKGLVYGISEDGQKAIWDTQQTSVGSVRYYGFRYGESGTAKSVYVPNSGYAIAPGFDSFQRGSWNINGTTPAMLHDGEMVIRRDDAPLVRSLLRESGDSGKYGATPMVGNSAKSESMMEQMIMLLSEIAGSIGILGNRPVNVDVRRVSDALDRFQRTRGAA